MQTRPQAPPDPEALIQQVIQEQFNGDCELPETGDKFSHHESAFAKWRQWDPQQHRRVYSCVHFGKPKNWRKLQGEAVSRETYDALDGATENGEQLRLRQGMLSRSCVIPAGQQRVSEWMYGRSDAETSITATTLCKQTWFSILSINTSIPGT
ncbi:hypothetical protein FN846DRAFT_993708 [Sphaerosporella brunnea]|uniref:Uncharacterized protein n=1 Tax=Sphaerosporella brunnea TaxID=1250544 RepID=A0A5J5EN19_9PEZI|nr:hypothetical protein FN846DRAFT_993708 [Sphaerosporella brunnea]